VITDLHEAETLRMADALATLEPDDWSKQTDCPKWTVRDMAGHVVGMTRTFTGLPQFVSHFVAGTRAAGDRPQIDGVTEVQVERNKHLPNEAIVRELRAAGLPASVSQTAGTFVCNHVFYGLMHALAGREDVKAGFIHIPFLPEQAAAHPGAASMSLASMVEGLRIAVRTALATGADIAAAGGATH